MLITWLSQGLEGAGLNIKIFLTKYFDSRFGLANAINDYLKIKIRVVYVGNF